MRRPSASRRAWGVIAVLVATVALCACDSDSAGSGDAVGEAPSPEATATSSPFAPSPAQVSAGCGAPEIGVGEGLALRGLVVSAERVEGAEPGAGWVAVSITVDSTSGDDDLPSGRNTDPGASFDVLILEQDLPLPAAGSCLIARGAEGSPDCGPACDAYGFIADEFALFPP